MKNSNTNESFELNFFRSFLYIIQQTLSCLFSASYLAESEQLRQQGAQIQLHQLKKEEFLPAIKYTHAQPTTNKVAIDSSHLKLSGTGNKPLKIKRRKAKRESPNERGGATRSPARKRRQRARKSDATDSVPPHAKKSSGHKIHITKATIHSVANSSNGNSSISNSSSSNSSTNSNHTISHSNGNGNTSNNNKLVFDDSQFTKTALFHTPDSLLTKLDLKTLFQPVIFESLSRQSQLKLIKLLPDCDRQLDSHGSFK